ncbi:MAG: hypothetical protein O3C40_23735 [Planctomycetota bacterium]|nr:hypothetical protein [Planctomycetota bacterium]
MAFHVSSRWGGDEAEPSVDRMRAILAELDANDDEHPDVALSHESEWCLSAYPSGLLVWENLEQGEPRHMNGIPRERVLALWLKLAQGQLDDIEAEPWLPGQYHPLERDTDFPPSDKE